MEAAQHPRIVPPTLLRALSHKSGEPPLIAASVTVSEALRHIAECKLEALAVIDGDRLVGIFSEHEFARHMLNGGSLSAPIGAAMSDFPAFSGPNDPVETWLEKTADQDIRYLPVVDGQHLLGILSRADLLAESDAHHRRVYQAIDLDHRIMFKRGTYSC